ncbi:MAG TPA: hypothetical protein VLK88_17925, partial [Gemmatimonadales bacterium]|nr:hypothetical protein [Gemmatimonadales bacterium]
MKAGRTGRTGRAGRSNGLWTALTVLTALSSLSVSSAPSAHAQVNSDTVVERAARAYQQLSSFQADFRQVIADS